MPAQEVCMSFSLPSAAMFLIRYLSCLDELSEGNVYISHLKNMHRSISDNTHFPWNLFVFSESYKLFAIKFLVIDFDIFHRIVWVSNRYKTKLLYEDCFVYIISHLLNDSS